MNGTGAGTGSTAPGVYIAANITAATGNISITGAGSSTATGTSNYGVFVNAAVSTGGTGTITLVGTATGNGSGLLKSLGTLATEIKSPDGGSMLWVFALPEK